MQNAFAKNQMRLAYEDKRDLYCMEGAPVLEPIEHSVLEKSLDGGPMEGKTMLEPLEHSVLAIILNGEPMEGAPLKGISAMELFEHPVLEALEHSVLAMTLDDRPLMELSVMEPLEHSVLKIALDGKLIEDLSLLEPLKHSVLVMSMDGGPMEEMTVLEPLEHSVLDMALDGRLMERMTVLEPLEHSVLQESRSNGPTVEMSVLEPLDVADVAPVWGDCSLIRMTVSDPLEHSGLGVTVLVDMDSLRMASWDAGGTLRRTYRHGMAVWRDVLCCVVRFSRMPVLPASGSLRSYGGLGRACIIDLYAGEDALVLGAAVDGGAVQCLWCETLRRDLLVGKRRGIFWISPRRLAACRCIVAVICVLQRIRTGKILTILLYNRK